MNSLLFPAPAADQGSRRVPSWLLLAAGLALAFAVLGWLMFGLAGHRAGMQSFPTPDGSTLEYRIDENRSWTAEEVRAAPEESWREWQGKYLEVQRGQALWLRARLVNPSPAPLSGVLADSEYLPDRTEAWVQGPRGDWQYLVSGEAISGAEKPLWSRTAAFPVSVPPEGSTTVFLRVTDFYLGTPWMRWWPEAGDFFEAQLRDTLAEAICYGVLLALVIYNFVLWARLRFPDTGNYVLYAGAMLLFNFASNGGLALLGIGLGSPVKEMLTAGKLAASGLFFVRFARIFLGTATVFPKTDRCES